MSGSGDGVQIWRRMGPVMSVPETSGRWRTHAQAPTILPLSGSCWRIYVGGRNAGNKPAVMFVEVDPTDSMRVIRVVDRPALDFGRPGSFDADGVMPACAWWQGDRAMLAYTGLNLASRERPSSAIGLAESRDGGETFERVTERPILGRGPAEPFGTFNPCILRSAEGAPVEMFYNSIRDLIVDAYPTLDPCYDIRRATPHGWTEWQPDGQAGIALTMPQANGLSRPWVMRSADGYAMWFSPRGRFSKERPELRRYRIRCASSADGRSWVQHPAGFAWANPPEEGDWDHEMQCYPCVVNRGAGRVMVYSGNWNGSRAIGYAVQEA